jgi:hypothetical protein
MYVAGSFEGFVGRLHPPGQGPLKRKTRPGDRRETGMDDARYLLCHDQGYFEAGRAGDRLVLLGLTVREVVAHWFDAEGCFLGLERFPIDVDIRVIPGGTVYRKGESYDGQVEAEMSALKRRLGFVPETIRVRRFESDEVAIFDLPGECEAFLESPGSYSPEDRAYYERMIAEWRARGDFVIHWDGEYWLTAEGSVYTRSG